jgi:hypothetical protein
MKSCSQRKKLSLLSIKRSPRKDKKLVATFCTSKGRTKQVHFGARGYQNYGGVGRERHMDPERKRRYIERHRSRENWNKPDTAGSLSRWILWNKSSLRKSIADYKRRFRL